MDKTNEIRLSGLRTLATVIEQGSISGAAKRLGLTPSAVSKQINRLEDDIGVRLLERSTRKVRPTEAGLKIHHHARPMLDELLETVQSVVEENAEISGVVRISATPTFGRIHLIPLLAGLSNEHPRLRFDLKLTQTVHDFVEDEIDIAIREGDLADSSAYSILLRDGTVKLCASPDYLRRRGPVESFDALSKHDLILVPLEGLKPSVSRAERVRLAASSARFIVNDLFSVRDLVLAGAGIAGLPEYMIETHLQSGELVTCLPDFSPMRLPVHAVYPSRRFVPRRVQVVLNALIEERDNRSPAR